MRLAAGGVLVAEAERFLVGEAGDFLVAEAGDFLAGVTDFFASIGYIVDADFF